MGIISRMREISPYFLGIFAVTFIVFMVVSDANLTSLMRGDGDLRKANIAYINGEPVNYVDFENRIKEVVEQQRQSNQGTEPDEEQIRQSMWDQIVEETVLRQEAKKAGIVVTKEEILDIMLDNPPEYLRRGFTDSAGNFNKDAYINVLTNPDVIKRNIEAAIRAGQIKQGEVNPDVEVAKFKDQLLKIEDFLYRQKLQDHMRMAVGVATSVISPTFTRLKYDDENATANFDYIAFDVNTAPALGKDSVTDAEAQVYYDANKQYYKQKPARKIKYVTFPLQPSSADTAAARRKVESFARNLQMTADAASRESMFRAFFAENEGKSIDYTNIRSVDPSRLAFLEYAAKDTIIGPISMPSGIFFFRVDDRRTGVNENVNASHILIGFGQNKDSAKALAASLVGRAKSGEAFSQLVAQYSEDQGSKMQGGDLGWFGKGKMVKPFEEACFGNPAGSIVGPIESQFGFHVINIKEKSSDEIKYSEAEVKVVMTSATRNNLKRDALSFKSQVESGTPFDTLAKRLKKNAVETEFFDRNQPILGSRSLTEFAFDSKPGTVRNPTEVKYYGIVVAQVVDERSAGVKQFVDIRDQIKRKLTTKKQLDILEAKAKAVFEKVKGKDLLARIGEIDPSVMVKTAAGVKNNGMIPGGGSEIVVTTTALMPKTPIGKAVGPIRGDRGVFIIMVTSRTPAPTQDLAQKLLATRTQLETQAKSMGYYQWLVSAKERADIKDERSKFYGE